MNRTNSTQTSGWQFKGRHALIAFFSLFGLFIIANTIMVTSAITTWSGLDRPKAYIHGLKYNEVLTSAATQKQSGWSGSLHIEQQESADLNLVFRPLKDGVISPKVDRVTASFRRPTMASMDQIFELSKTSDGDFILLQSFSATRGQWDVDLTAYAGPIGQEVQMFRSIQRVILE
jgi:nitrogen fixation protein FixH